MASSFKQRSLPFNRKASGIENKIWIGLGNKIGTRLDKNWKKKQFK